MPDLIWLSGRHVGTLDHLARRLSASIRARPPLLGNVPLIAGRTQRNTNDREQRIVIIGSGLLIAQPLLLELEGGVMWWKRRRAQ